MKYDLFCQVCGITFQSEFPQTKYHSEICRAKGKRLSEQKYHRDAKKREYELAAESLRQIQQPAPRRLLLPRAASLAETPEIPARATRDDVLTGAAPAASYGTSVGFIKVGV